MAVVCAWCGKVLQDGGASVSHGICAECSVQFEASAGLGGGRNGNLHPFPRRPRRAIAATLPLPGFGQSPLELSLLPGRVPQDA